jgi:DNA-binding XRE family transcriptional regulator
VNVDRAEFIAICDSKVKLVRVEHGFSQEKMASVLGLSKKTLVEIEKGRRTLGWMGSVVLCTIFIDSEVLSGVFGGTPTDIILALAFEGRQLQYRKTTGGLIWWSTLRENDHYIIQQNILSQHYRLLDREGRRIVSSFDIDDLLPIFQGIA